ncbi:M48 family metalloprotease [Nonomuraea sp. NPDC046802]|uniref:M48 family metalloprotease n=1 Tax=Nonomuraea sp. NPDC046802 TaxID=3154919 RepID=UPI0033E75D40
MSSLDSDTTHTVGEDAVDVDRHRLAGLVWRVQEVGRYAALNLVLDPELGDNAMTSESGRCGRAPLIAVGRDLLGEHRTDTLMGTLAHELAHRDLAHHKRQLPDWLATGRDLTAIGAMFAAYTALITPAGRWWWAAAALFVAALALAALRARLMRLEEYDADARAAEILDRNDLPGRRIVTAMLADTAARPHDPWYAHIGWPLSTHPIDVDRIDVLDSGRRAGRLDWRTALCCVATGERLLTRAHRAAHAAAGDSELRRCRPGWWHLPPVWWRPTSWPK